MGNAGAKILAGMQEALIYAQMQAKADVLLAAGDAASRDGNKAESRRLLRQCRRYRLKARAYATEHSPIPGSKEK